jgi:hypothetical protein
MQPRLRSFLLAEPASGQSPVPSDGAISLTIMHILEMSIIGHPIFFLAFHNLSLKHHSEKTTAPLL